MSRPPRAKSSWEIAHNYQGGAMLGTKCHNWWRIGEPDKWWVKESEHFRHCVDKKEMSEWDQARTKAFHDRLPGMFELSESVCLASLKMAKQSSSKGRR